MKKTLLILTFFLGFCIYIIAQTDNKEAYIVVNNNGKTTIILDSLSLGKERTEIIIKDSLSYDGHNPFSRHDKNNYKKRQLRKLVIKNNGALEDLYEEYTFIYNDEHGIRDFYNTHIFNDSIWFSHGTEARGGSYYSRLYVNGYRIIAETSRGGGLYLDKDSPRGDKLYDYHYDNNGMIIEIKESNKIFYKIEYDTIETTKKYHFWRTIIYDGISIKREIL